jgi:hypothetical protein
MLRIPIGGEHSAQYASIDYDVDDEANQRSYFDYIFRVLKAIVAFVVSVYMLAWGWGQVRFNPDKGFRGLLICFLAVIPMYYALSLLLG